MALHGKFSNATLDQGSFHAHSCTKLKTDHGLCQLNCEKLH